MSENLWSGAFGIKYTNRNRVDWQTRIPFWDQVIERTQPRSVLEVGCNAGWNLRAIRAIDPSISLVGIDVNEAALEEADAAGLDVEKISARGATSLGLFDLVFSAGVLIHIPPGEIDTVMAAIVEAARHWVVAVEYSGEVEQEIPYRGLQGALWKRPFGEMYEAMGLTLVETGTLEKSAGFDDCTFWVLRK